MRGILVLFAVAGTMACEKQRFCDCHLLRGTSVRDASNFETTYVFNFSRAAAEDACGSHERSGTDDKGRFVRDCEIKNNK